MKSRITLLILAFLIQKLHAATPNAFCHYPVVDLVGHSASEARAHHPHIYSYDHLPCSGNQSNKELSRITQLLFNEPVQILEETAHEVKIKIFHWYHQIGNPTQKVDTYFAPKKYFTRFADLTVQDRAALPSFISFSKATIPIHNTVTLLEGYYDKKTHLTYSAGTRFCKAQDQPKDTFVAVYRYNNHTKKTDTLLLPQDLCLTQLPTTATEQRELFIEILRKWTDNQDGVVPYVLGGASVGIRHPDNDIVIKKPKNMTLYYRSKSKKRPYYGLDCSHMIARAAQIVGINVFVKNTSTLRATFPALKENEEIENGDILVWRGHTVVISDVKKGLMIESRGYPHGYGKMQEIPLSEQFKGIETVDQLRNAYFTKKKIIRLDKAGNTVQIIDDLVIIKLPVE